jgi:hypothetical protein
VSCCDAFIDAAVGEFIGEPVRLAPDVKDSIVADVPQ